MNNIKPTVLWEETVHTVQINYCLPQFTRDCLKIVL